MLISIANETDGEAITQDYIYYVNPIHRAID